MLQKCWIPNKGMAVGEITDLKTKMTLDLCYLVKARQVQAKLRGIIPLA